MKLKRLYALHQLTIGKVNMLILQVLPRLTLAVTASWWWWCCKTHQPCIMRWCYCCYFECLKLLVEVFIICLYNAVPWYLQASVAQPSCCLTLQPSTLHRYWVSQIQSSGASWEPSNSTLGWIYSSLTGRSTSQCLGNIERTQREATTPLYENFTGQKHDVLFMLTCCTHRCYCTVVYTVHD